MINDFNNDDSEKDREFREIEIFVLNLIISMKSSIQGKRFCSSLDLHLFSAIKHGKI